ncbi:D-glutamate cyclase, mitochondrial-like isoform X3 [Platichthys flesus]|uniref:D-glutamate cyclase, mitochondrial-like isoform X3 n=1 Tax=Platichthys flesus TaxID=8260 RepID=UPI002DBFDDE3|nr:D-glutamate cyclase, mitochondrial-like isoform X3 [Platichthys flesus]
MRTAFRATRCSLSYLRGFSTSAMDAMSGYMQANVAILPNHLADDFEAFCQSNPASLPLLYRSQSGETSCPPLARHADISPADTLLMTDMSQYCVYEKGQLMKTVSSLQSYTDQARNASDQQDVHHGHQWSDMVCFYLGCSFGFEGRLKTSGVPIRNVEQGRNVSMYRTAVPCIPAGVFSCPVVVSMRPVPAEKLDAAVEVSHLSPLSHGAPIHIGEPAVLGILDLCRPDYGDRLELQPGDVPVFWACGVTAIQAIRSTKPSLAFSHSPGSMFLTDIPDSPTSTISTPSDSRNTPYIEPNPGLIPLCILVSHKPLLYSLASQRAVSRIRDLEKIIGEDPGQRGIQVLCTQDELLRSSLALSHSSSVAITTGFPTHYMHSPPDVTDGPPGAIAMATMLLSLGKQVTMVTDRRALEMNQALIDEAVKTGVLKTAIPLVTFEDCGPDAALHFLCHHGDPSKPRYDHLVAIERSGRAEDGNYYNMRGVNIKHLVDPIDDLFIAAKDIPGIITTGIGDGGNELGMGKLKETVKNLMPNGTLIACDVPADYAITAGVSNWGGYAVACGLYLLHTCPSHQRYLKKGLGEETPAPQEQLRDWIANLPSVDKEESFLSTLVRFGIRSGKTAHLAMEVDGLTFHPTHSDIITRLLEVTQGSTSQNP